MNIVELANGAGRSARERLGSCAAVGIMVVLASGLLLLGGAVGESVFNEDSWGYFELSKTFFSGHFYRFNTIRSYLPNEYSASFPFGYPVLLALVQALTGANPLTGVYVNIGAAVATVALFRSICTKLQLDNLVWLAISLSLLLYPDYLDELFSGRSIPCALLLYVGAFAAVLHHKPSLSGLMLGGAALVRFDYLVYSILFQGVVLFSRNTTGIEKGKILVGFALGISPWVAFSYLHFGKLWMSDNSWVAVSALPAHVTDYPAAPSISAFQEPGLWLARVLNNFQRVLRRLIRASFYYPSVAAFALILLLKWPRWWRAFRYQLLVATLVVCGAVAPYALTGYLDSRYFCLIFTVLNLALLAAVTGSEETLLSGLDPSAVVLLVMVLTLGTGGNHLTDLLLRGIHNGPRVAAENAKIASVFEEHRKKPGVRFIFVGATGDYFATKYGALTGMKTALIASNFDAMSPAERDRYFRNLQPCTVIPVEGVAH